MRSISVVVSILALCHTGLAFSSPFGKTKVAAKSNPLPTYDKTTERWEATAGDKPAYGPFGSFLRQGPSPALVRVLTPDDYDQAVLKYMAREKCDRAEAQGNMDAYFNNAADWAYQKPALWPGLVTRLSRVPSP